MYAHPLLQSPSCWKWAARQGRLGGGSGQLRGGKKKIKIAVCVRLLRPGPDDCTLSQVAGRITPAVGPRKILFSPVVVYEEKPHNCLQQPVSLLLAASPQGKCCKYLSIFGEDASEEEVEEVKEILFRGPSNSFFLSSSLLLVMHEWPRHSSPSFPREKKYFSCGFRPVNPYPNIPSFFLELSIRSVFQHISQF